ncbi:MAG TPA: DUF1553 domain-containing protein [Bryobacteraceae bacterium]|nr:DUF1553 domain-containing protein [Bryobacteraceae bacterium]
MKRLAITASLIVSVAGGGAWLLRAQNPFQDPGGTSLDIAHAECTYFSQRDRFTPKYAKQHSAMLGTLTNDVTSRLGTSLVAHATGAQPLGMPSAPGGSRTYNGQSTSSSNLIDVYIWQAFKANSVTPAAPTNDYEFVRRVYLDLTGKIPTADAVMSFVNDTTPNKRATLIDSLLGSSAWVDRWTMFYGDLFKNASNWPTMSTAVSVYGRDAFNAYIRNWLTTSKPYNQVASDLIGSQGTNNFSQGDLNWQISGRVVGTGIPIQDTWDQQTANVADTFLGISHMNCLLCHDGRGHLTTLSLWGSTFTRYQAWGFSSFMSHTNLQAPKDPTTGQALWYVNDTSSKTNYPLNTTSGNRPPRQPTGSVANIVPAYPFGGQGPTGNEGYRQAMARLVTSDFQFARASVNYLWAAFFGVGLVDPPDQFDPARLDPNNPPPAGWTLQPSNPDLLNALAADFIQNNYDVKHTMRLIANSNTYQLESQYDPNTWNPNWQTLYARKLVRRIWGEEAMDSISVASGITNTFKTNNVTYNWAMQLPETGNNVEGSAFLQSFLPGNRDDQPRRPDGAIQQALVLMNDGSVMNKLVTSANGAPQTLLTKSLGYTSNQDLINSLYINILSRFPTAAETQTAETLLGTNSSATVRMQKAQELMWTLFNKVDFMFNY